MKMQNIKKLLLFFPFVFFASLAFASTGGGGLGNPTSPAPHCAVNDPAGKTCATATPICDLNGYCGSTSASYTAEYWSELNTAFCGSIENNSFLIFYHKKYTINYQNHLFNAPLTCWWSYFNSITGLTQTTAGKNHRQG
jgi:hypothetical protein